MRARAEELQGSAVVNVAGALVDAREQLITEEWARADGPPQLAGVTRTWEAAAGEPADRSVVFHTSVVVDRDTPALDRRASTSGTRSFRPPCAISSAEVGGPLRPS